MTPVEDPGIPVEPSDARQPPARISPALWIPAIYATASIAWIAFSDRFVADVAGTADAQAFWSTAKGIGFVAVTSFLLALGIRWALGRERASARRIAETQDFFRSGFEDHAAVKLLIEPGSGKIVDANHEAAAFYGWPRERLRQMRIHEINLLPEEVVTAEMRRAQENDRAHLDFRHRLADGSVRDVTVFSSRVRLNGRKLLHSIVQDVTERKQAERELRKVQRTLLMISGCMEAILHAVAEDELFSEVCRVVVERGGYRMCWVGVPGGDDRRLIVPVAHAGHEDGYLREITVSWADVPEGRGPTGTAVREGRVVIGKDFRKDPSLAVWTDAATRRGYGSSVALPLMRGDQRFGALTMYAEGLASFSEEELALLRTLADDLAFGVHALRQRGLRDRADAERKRALQELAVQKDRFQALIDHSSDVTLVIDAKGIVTFISPSALGVLGIAPSEIVGRPVSELIHPEDQARAAKTLGALIEGREKSQRHELRLRRAGGGWATLDAIRTAMLDHPAIRGIVVNSRDITERVETERLLRERERFLDMVLATSLDAFWVVDTTGQIREANDAACSMLGFTREELLARKIGDVEAQMDADEIAARMRKLVEDGGARFESRHHRKDGSTIVVEVSAKLLPFAGGRIVAFIRDVTERRTAETAVRSSEALLRAIANSSPDSIFAKDREGRWTFANTAALRVAGKPAGEALGRTDAEITGDAALGSLLTTNDREVMETGTARSFEEIVPGPTGARRFLSTKAPLRDPDGRVVGIAGVAKDVTEMHKLQEQLAVASRLAAMGTLVAGVSHEVNNPLAGVLASSALATDDAKDARRLLGEDTPTSRAEATRLLEQVLDSLADAQTGSQRIAQIVKDLSLFARPNPQRVRVRVIEVVQQALRWLPPSVQTTVTLRVENRGAPDVMASFGQIGQVLVNLVTNAVKAAPRGTKGEVVIRLGPGEPGMARIEVVDNGVGMAPDLIERIFDPFFTTRPAGEGTGLGLPIIHAIVTAHGGNITVESEVGKGSTFRVELPAAPPEA